MLKYCKNANSGNKGLIFSYIIDESEMKLWKRGTSFSSFHIDGSILRFFCCNSVRGTQLFFWRWTALVQLPIVAVDVMDYCRNKDRYYCATIVIKH